MAEAKISIVVAVRNSAKTLQRCIDSVLTQSYTNAELIVIDGNSTDGTREILQRNAQQIAYWESEPDRGIYHAWNKGLQHISGDWVCFLGADDWFWHRDVLTVVSKHLADAYPRARIVYGKVAVVAEDGKILGEFGEPWKIMRQKFLGYMMVLIHQGMFQHMSLFQERGRFDESFEIAGDYELLLRELRTEKALFVPGLVVAGMRQGGVSSRYANRLKLFREVFRAKRKNGVSVLSASFLYGFVLALLQSRLSRVVGEKRAESIGRIYRACKRLFRRHVQNGKRSAER